MATASGIWQLIQSRSATESSPPASHKFAPLTRHSIQFDVKFTGSASVPQLTSDPKSAVVNSGYEDVDCTLVGSWSQLWEVQLNSSPHGQEPYTQFYGVKLQSYTGHKSAVKSIAVSDSERFFVSGSKDKTVKLWLLKNQAPSSPQLPPRVTYSRHQKSVFQVELLETMGCVISCDGTVHLWDPETGLSIQTFSSPRGKEILAMKLLPPPQPVAIVATSDFSLKFIDLRAKAFQHTWKLHFPTGGVLKCLTCTENWVAVGNYTGSINTLDMRMGEFLHSWKPSDFSPVQTNTWNESLFQLRATRGGNLVSSVGAGTIHLWRASTGKLLSHIRGQSSTTHCLETIGEQLVTASSNGHISIHNCFEHTRDPSSALHWETKVKARELKGGVVSMATLQENRLLLLGSDNGQVVLMT